MNMCSSKGMSLPQVLLLMRQVILDPPTGQIDHNLCSSVACCAPLRNTRPLNICPVKTGKQLTVPQNRNGTTSAGILKGSSVWLVKAMAVFAPHLCIGLRVPRLSLSKPLIPASIPCANHLPRVSWLNSVVEYANCVGSLHSIRIPVKIASSWARAVPPSCP